MEDPNRLLAPNIGLRKSEGDIHSFLLCEKGQITSRLVAQAMGVRRRDELEKEVLRDVSRSFYLTLRALPKEMRPAVSVAYLLARASDTIADCEAPRSEREELLCEFQRQLTGGAGGAFLRSAIELAEGNGLKDGERVLMRRLGEVFAWLSRLQRWEQDAVQKVVSTITEGQQWDLQYFSEDRVVTVESEDELLRYCYLVAGCVGEFWTEIGFGSNARFANRPVEEMTRLGQNYGCGLQLVNILRDVTEDRQRGRNYLPGPREEWFSKAEAFLQDGLTYSRAVRSPRARLATVLPVLLGLETLALLRTATEDELAVGVKVSRRAVRRCSVKALFFR
jgi:farnesyl-diphosphate farnesyltransferase